MTGTVVVKLLVTVAVVVFVTVVGTVIVVELVTVSVVVAVTVVVTKYGLPHISNMRSSLLGNQLEPPLLLDSRLPSG